jgi:hypothetical protein
VKLICEPAFACRITWSIERMPTSLPLSPLRAADLPRWHRLQGCVNVIAGREGEIAGRGDIRHLDVGSPEVSGAKAQYRMFRSVIVLLKHPGSSTTGSAPQPPFHIISATCARLSLGVAGLDVLNHDVSYLHTYFLPRLQVRV